MLFVLLEKQKRDNGRHVSTRNEARHHAKFSIPYFRDNLVASRKQSMDIANIPNVCMPFCHPKLPPSNQLNMKLASKSQTNLPHSGFVTTLSSSSTTTFPRSHSLPSPSPLHTTSSSLFSPLGPDFSHFCTSCSVNPASRNLSAPCCFHF